MGADKYSGEIAAYRKSLPKKEIPYDYDRLVELNDSKFADYDEKIDNLEKAVGALKNAGGWKRTISLLICGAFIGVFLCALFAIIVHYSKIHELPENMLTITKSAMAISALAVAFFVKKYIINPSG